MVLSSFGQEAPAAAPTIDVLNHDLVEWRKRRALYLRLVASRSEALDYAAGGFHVAVWRGLPGGCTQPWTIHESGTKAGSGCAATAALNNPATREQWAKAAALYRHAYGMAKDGSPLLLVKAALKVANAASDVAYGQEGIAPPRDPVTQEPEPAGAVETKAQTAIGSPWTTVGAAAGWTLAWTIVAALTQRRGRRAAEM